MTRIVKETAKTGSSVGNAVTATDSDNDPLLYRLTDGDETPDVVGSPETIGVQHIDSDSNTDTLRALMVIPSGSDKHQDWTDCGVHVEDSGTGEGTV